MNKLITILITFTLATIPLYVVRCKNLSYCPSPVPLNFLEVAILITFTVWLLNKIFVKKTFKKDFFKTLNLIPFVLRVLLGIFLLAAFVEAVIFPHPLLPLGIFKGYFLEPALFFWIILDYLRETKNTKQIVWAILFSGVWLSLFGIFEKILKWNPFNPQEFAERGRVSALYTSSNAVGLFIIPLIFLGLGYLLYLIFNKKIDLKNWEVKVLLLGLLILFFGQVVSGSRGGWLAFFGSSLFFLLFLFFKKQTQNFQKLFTKIFVFGLALFFLFNLLFLFNLNSTINYNQRTKLLPAIEPRLCLWQGSVNLIKTNPIFGSGLRQFQTKYVNFHTCSNENALYPHNVFLDFWTETGFLGLVSFVAIGIYLFFRLLSSREINYLSLGLATIWVSFLLHGLLDNPYFNNDLSVSFWVFVALAVFQISIETGFRVRFFTEKK